MSKFVILFISTFFLAQTLGKPSGAPDEVCDTMAPKHFAHVQQNAPFEHKIKLDKATVEPAGRVKLNLSGPRPFKGFQIEIRDGDKAVGKFDVNEDDKNTRTMDCHGGEHTAVTHKSPVDKESVDLIWVAPEKKATYNIYITLVESFSKFWAFQPAGTITVE